MCCCMCQCCELFTLYSSSLYARPVIRPEVSEKLSNEALSGVRLGVGQCPGGQVDPCSILSVNHSLFVELGQPALAVSARVFLIRLKASVGVQVFVSGRPESSCEAVGGVIQRRS